MMEALRATGKHNLSLEFDNLSSEFDLGGGIFILTVSDTNQTKAIAEHIQFSVVTLFSLNA